MTILRKLTLVSAVTALAVTLFGAMPSAEAAKEVFEQTKPHVNVGTLSHTGTAKAKRTRQLRARSGNSFGRTFHPKPFKRRTANPASTAGQAKLKSNAGPVKDLYCGGKHHVPCDYIFKNYCKLIGGTLSPSGTTCYHRTEW